MNLLHWAGRSLGVRPGEGRSVALMTAHSFAMGASTVFFETAASALFLAQFDKTYLPWVYIAAALLNLGTGYAYASIKDRVSFARLMAGTLVFLLVSVVSVRVGLLFSGAAWLVFASLVWYRVLSILTDLEYWAVAARLYDVREAKRLFGLIGSGEVVARIAGAFSVPLLLRFMGVPNLILLSGAALALCLVLLLAVLPLLAARADGEPAPRGRRAAARRSLPEQLREILSHPYLSLVVALAVLAVFGKYFVDFAFLEQMRARMSDAKELAGFFAIFSGVTQGLSLLTRVFVSGPVLTRLGVRVGMLVLPVTHLLCTLAIVAVGSLAVGEMAVFWLVIANQGIYKVLKHPIDNPSFKVLYQPLRRDERLGAQIAIEVIFTPITIGVAGGIMLLMSKAVQYDPVRFAWVLLATFAAWVLLGRRAGRAYAGALLDVLRRRIAEDAPFGLDDATSLTVLRSKLDSPSAGEVVFALHLLERADDATLGPALVAKLDHPEPEVRRFVLERIEALRPNGALEPLRRRAALETVPAVKSAALRALATLGGQQVAEDIAAFVRSPDPVVRRGAVTALLLVADKDGSRTPALSYLQQMARSPEREDRVVAAQIIGDSGLDSMLPRLLGDAEAPVRRAALQAAGRLGRGRHWPAAARAVEDPHCSGVAAAALIAGGETALPPLEPLLGAQDSPTSTQVHVARIFGAVRGPAAVRALRAHLDHPDEVARAELLAALAACGYRAQGDEAADVMRRLNEEAADAAWKLAVHRDLGDDPKLATLREAIEDEVALCQRRVFLLLSFLYDPRAILSARDNVSHASKDKRAYALEVLDVTLDGPAKGTLLPLLDDRPRDARLHALSEHFPQRTRGRDERLEELLARDDRWLRTWTRAAAMHAIGRLGIAALAAPLERLQGGAPLQRETAAWALASLGTGPTFEGDASMLLIEKVMILKGVQMFEETSEELLTEIARILEEIDVEKDEEIFEKGDIGDSMYIIIEGQVRIFDGERTINVLGEKEIFGELALLDPEPRSASVAATRPSRLFRLDRETFSQLMAGNIEIVRGVLHVLCERLRRVTSFAVTPR